MTRIRTAIVALSLSISSAAPALAQVIDFDDLPASTHFIPQGYAGFAWVGGGDISGIPETSWLLSISCFSFCGVQPVSSPFFAWTNASNYGVMARSTRFDLLSVFMAGTDLRGDPNETVRGYRNGVEVYTKTVPLDPSFTLQKYAMDFVSVDSVRFDGRSGYGNLLVDDIAYSVSPEPASIWLVASGLAGVFAIGRRRASRSGHDDRR